MNSIKIFFLTILLASAFSTNQIHAKFSLSKIKNKLKESLNKATKQTKKTFNKLIKKSKKESQIDEKELAREAFFNAISNVDQAKVKGLNVQDRRLAKKMKKAKKAIKNFFWAKQDKFIEELELFLDQSKEQCRKIFYEKIEQVYASKKTPVIDFAVQLDQELKKSGEFIKDLSEFNINMVEDKAKLNELDSLLDELDIIDIKLEKLSLIVDDLLRA